MKIVVFDTETSGLTRPIPTSLEYQPYISEISAVKFDEDFNFIGEFDTLVKPPISLSKEITKITGITNEMVEDAPPFFDIYSDLYDFFRDVDILVAQNISFDVSVLEYELFRHNLQNKFAWPKRHLCTIEASYHYKNKRMKLADLHEFLTGKSFDGAHRAMVDVQATVRCFMELVKRGDVTL